MADASYRDSIAADRAAAIAGARFPLWLAALALLLAFTLLGSRPLWDPDEGRYSNVALHMLESGDWVHPMRNHEEGHWTKPPLTYWAVASAVAVFGYTPWAARLPVALAYLACVWLAWRLARRLAPGREALAGLAFASMALPMAAAQVLTTDFLLAAFEGLAVWGYVEARFGPRAAARRWLWLMWLGFALAFLTKGPPALLPLLGILAFQWLGPKEARAPLPNVPGLLLFLVLSLSWFLLVVAGEPRLLPYFLGEEVMQRVAGHGFQRNSQWYGWLLVYAPTLLLGSLPWTARILRALRLGLPGLRPARARVAFAEPEAAASGFLLLWLLLPLLVLCLAQSRLPLYVLPLFLPLALLAARARPRPPAMIWLLGVIAGLLALRLLAAQHETHKDASAWAEAIGERSDFPVREVVFVDDMARYGLHLHLGAEVEKVTLHPLPEPRPLSDESGHGFAEELREREPDIVYITKAELLPELARIAAGEGLRLRQLGAPFHGRVILVAEAAGTSPL